MPMQKETRPAGKQGARKSCRYDTLRMIAHSKTECIFAACCTALCIAVVYGLAAIL